MAVVYFFVFSTMEAMSMFAIMLALFRFRLMEYFGYYLTLSFILTLLNYCLWRELDVPGLVPVAGVFLFSLALFVRNGISLIAAVVVSMTGYLVFGAVQTLVLYGLEAAHLAELQRVQSNTGDTYLMQTVSSAALFIVSYLLYRRGYGFTFPLDRLGRRGGNRAIFALMGLAVLLLAAVSLLASRMTLAACMFLAAMLFLIVALDRKERLYVRSLVVAHSRQPEAGDTRSSR